MASLNPWRNKQIAEGQEDEFPLARLRNEMDRLFESFLREPFGALQSAWRERAGWMPPVDIAESDTEVTIRAELPGMDPKDLDVSVHGNNLVLRGEKKESNAQKDKGYYQAETRYGSFHRSVPLPQGVDPNQVDATYSNGVLTLVIKKSPEAAPKKIEVRAG
jgi:HSP20 family protein